jgi:hypothetical protein
MVADDADYVKCWKAFKESEQFRKWTDDSSLNLHPKQKQYLENRILAAFEHGWNMCQAATAQETRGALHEGHCAKLNGGACSCGAYLNR